MLNVTCKLRRPYLRAGMAEKQDLHVMLKLAPQGEAPLSHPPLALALVFDTSGSMGKFVDQEALQREAASGTASGIVVDREHYIPVNRPDLPTKLDEAQKAAHALADDPRLLAEDQLAVIQFDDRAETLLPLEPLGDRRRAHRAIEELPRRPGGTRMADGVQCALEQFRDLPGHVVKRVFLLTDGRTQGDEAECARLAEALAELNAPLVSIGIGEEYNEELMLQLADLSRGRAYHLEKMAHLGYILNQEVGAAAREVVTDLQATVAVSEGVTLERITRVFPSIAEVPLSGDRHRLGNVMVGDYTVFILGFSVDAGKAAGDSTVAARLAEVQLSGHSPALSRSDTLPPYPVEVAFTRTAGRAEEEDAEVAGYVEQANVDRMIHEAARVAKENRLRAEQLLRSAASVLLQVGNAPAARRLEEGLDELKATGSISAGRTKTMIVGSRTITVKPEMATPLPDSLTAEEIRRLTGA
jgi:Ca-activated chloride channel family protein